MAGELPEFYCRIRENARSDVLGSMAKTDSGRDRTGPDRDGRWCVNGDPLAHGGHELTAVETAEILAPHWLEDWRALLARRDRR